MPLQWRHNERDGDSNHQPHNCLSRPRSRKTSKLRVTGLCEGNSPVTGGFPTQRASNAEICFHLMTSSCNAWSRTMTRYEFENDVAPNAAYGHGNLKLLLHTSKLLIWNMERPSNSSICTPPPPLFENKICHKIVRGDMLRIVQYCALFHNVCQKDGIYIYTHTHI